MIDKELDKFVDDFLNYDEAEVNKMLAKLGFEIDSEEDCDVCKGVIKDSIPYDVFVDKVFGEGGKLELENELTEYDSRHSNEPYDIDNFVKSMLESREDDVNVQ